MISSAITSVPRVPDAQFALRINILGFSQRDKFGRGTCIRHSDSGEGGAVLAYDA
jgi:hypothetical protein